MSRKDYVLLAAAIRAAYENVHGERAMETGVLSAADHIIVALKHDNAAFQAPQFWRAAGLPGRPRPTD